MKAREHLRIIGVIAGKDLIDAVRNRVLLTVLMSVAFMMLSSQVIGWIGGMKNETVIYAFDRGSSKIFRDARHSRDMLLVETRSFEDLLAKVGAAPGPALGVVFPAGFDKAAAAGIPKIALYISNRETAASADALIAAFEQRFTRSTGLEVEGSLQEKRAFPTEDASDYPMMMGIGLVMGVMTIGLILTPYLVIDEKITHTLDALLVSPATNIHLAAGKLITGLSYCLAGSLLVIAFNWRWVVHWELMLPAVFLGALLASSVGLLIGVTVKHPTTVNMVAGLVIALLMLPLMFWPNLASMQAELWGRFASWLPSICMYRLARQSFTEAPEAASVLLNVGALATACLVVTGCLAARLRQIGNR